jgi:hypothetical protein
LARRKARKAQNGRAARPKVRSPNNGEISASKESIKAAEDLALTAFASGLKLAAAFGTVAAKTTSLALASIATGADKFSELIRQESMRSGAARSQTRSRRIEHRTGRRSRTKIRTIVH